MKSLSIVDTKIANSRQFGIRLQSSVIEVAKIASTKLEDDTQGIVISHISHSEVTIENCAINGSLYQGIYLIMYNDENTVSIVNSSVTASGDRGLNVHDCVSSNSTNFSSQWYCIFFEQEGGRVLLW